MQELVPGFRATTEEYQDAMLALLHRLNRLLALALDLPADYFDPMFDPPMCSLRPLHYIARVSNPEEVRPPA
jgi:isopenicillin N synthase-like dioxygenase